LYYEKGYEKLKNYVLGSALYDKISIIYPKYGPLDLNVLKTLP